MSARSPLVDQALSGTQPRLTRLAAQGLLPLAPDELVPLQVALTAHPDDEVAAAARQSLATTQVRVLLGVLQQTSDVPTLSYLARESAEPEVVEAAVRRRELPATVLVEIAPRVGPALQEALVLRQDRIVEEPAILEALERNPQLSTYARRRIQEYREHLLRGDDAESESEPAAEGEELPGHRDPEVVAALAATAPPAAGEERDEETGIAESQVRMLPIPVRLKLARGAPRTLRQFLIRDSNPRVAVAVLESNPLADQEVEQFAKSRSVVEDVLERIARERRWVSKYPIMLALVSNPRVPVGIAVKLVPRLSVRDLRNLARDRNVGDAVRSLAQRLYRIKSQ